MLGVSCDDYRQHGAFAEYVVVPQHILYRLPDSVTFEQAVLVEALSIAVHAVERAKISLGDSVAVVGAGMIGLLVIQALRIAGAGKIIAVDVDEGRLELAKRLGATIDGEGPIRMERRRRYASSATEGAPIAPSRWSGSRPPWTSRLMRFRKGGKLILVGNLAPSIAFPLQSIVTREITIYGCCSSRGEYPVCLDLIGSHKIDTAAIISAVASALGGRLMV